MATKVGKLSAVLSLNSAKFSKGLNRATRKLSRFTKSVKRISLGIAKFGLAMSAVAGAALTVMVKNSLKAIDAIAKLSDRIGISTEKISAFGHAAELGGSSSADMNKALEIFVRRLGEVRMGTGEAKDGLEALGLSADELVNAGAGEAFILVSEALNKIKAPADKAAAAYKLFGRQGQKLLNTLALGRDGFSAISTEASKLGITFSRIDAARVEQANDAMQRLRGVITGASNTLAVLFAPLVTEVSKRLTELGTRGGGAVELIKEKFDAMLRIVGKIADFGSILESIFRGLGALLGRVLQIPINAVNALLKGVSALNQLVGGKAIGSGFDTFTKEFNKNVNLQSRLSDEALNRGIDGVASRSINNFVGQARSRSDELLEELVRETRGLRQDNFGGATLG